jgi:hypothetical protein
MLSTESVHKSVGNPIGGCGKCLNGNAKCLLAIFRAFKIPNHVARTWSKECNGSKRQLELGCVIGHCARNLSSVTTRRHSSRALQQAPPFALRKQITLADLRIIRPRMKPTLVVANTQCLCGINRTSLRCQPTNCRVRLQIQCVLH